MFFRSHKTYVRERVYSGPRSMLLEARNVDFAPGRLRAGLTPDPALRQRLLQEKYAFIRYVGAP